MNELTGTVALVRLALRRDRLVLPLWVLGFVLVAAASAAASSDLYPTVGSRVEAAATVNSTTSLVALYGRVYDPTSLGSLAMWKLGGLGAAVLGVVVAMNVVRHTRAEEEAGRLELVGATVVGRRAPLTAALLVAFGACLVLGLLTAFGLATAGLPSTGSLAFGASWAAVGCCFAAVAAVGAQVTRSARLAGGIAVTVLGAAFLLRAVGDSARPGGPTWVSWLSPIGWGQQVRPFAGERWWVLLIPLVFVCVLVAAAYVLVAHRDLDAGLLPDRAGPAHASSVLASPLGLAWRLHRSTLLAWSAGFLVLGAVLGNIASGIEGLLSNPQLQEILQKLGGGQSLTDAFLSAELGLVGVVASAYGVQAALRMRTEESADRAEPVLAAAVARTEWAGSHLVLALGGTAVLLVVAGAGAGLGHGLQAGDVGHQVPRLVGSALASLPAAWVPAALVALTFGVAPRWVWLGWGVLVGFLFLGELGPLFQLEQWVMDLSPFAHVPRLPGGAFSPVPLLWLTALVVALVAGGLVGFRRRDLG